MSDVTQELVLDERLAGELQRRGIEVRAGDRVRLQLVSKEEHDDQEIAAWDAFVGGFTSEESDLAERLKTSCAPSYPVILIDLIS
jgi:hypothetical protein